MVFCLNLSCWALSQCYFLSFSSLIRIRRLYDNKDQEGIWGQDQEVIWGQGSRSYMTTTRLLVLLRTAKNGVKLDETTPIGCELVMFDLWWWIPNYKCRANASATQYDKSLVSYKLGIFLKTYSENMQIQEKVIKSMKDNAPVCKII